MCETRLISAGLQNNHPSKNPISPSSNKTFFFPLAIRARIRTLRTSFG